MFPVADDFAAIAMRLKEIQAELAKERTETEPRREPDDRRQPDTQYMHGDIVACA